PRSERGDGEPARKVFVVAVGSLAIDAVEVEAAGDAERVADGGVGTNLADLFKAEKQAVETSVLWDAADQELMHAVASGELRHQAGEFDEHGEHMPHFLLCERQAGDLADIQASVASPTGDVGMDLIHRHPEVAITDQGDGGDHVSFAKGDKDGRGGGEVE